MRVRKFHRFGKPTWPKRLPAWDPRSALVFAEALYFLDYPHARTSTDGLWSWNSEKLKILEERSWRGFVKRLAYFLGGGEGRVCYHLFRWFKGRLLPSDDILESARQLAAMEALRFP